LELKAPRGASGTLIREGIEQTVGYMDRCGSDKGHQIVFERKGKSTWEEWWSILSQKYLVKFLVFSSSRNIPSRLSFFVL
jgi:hypothetical protein